MASAKSDQSYSFIKSTPYNLRPSARFNFDHSKKFIIITAGPTGSGKSDLTKKTVELLYKTRKTPVYEEFLIDDLVENSDTYKELINKIIDDYECRQSITDGKCNLLNPSPEILADFEKAYMKIRREGPCNVDSDNSCDILFEEKLKAAVLAEKNISIETTGNKVPLKYISQIDLSKYNVVFVYSLVNFENLLKRNSSRATNAMQTYFTDASKSAPRLPDVSRKHFKVATSKIISTIIKLRNLCMRQGKPPGEDCGKINSNRGFTLLIFDNNKAKKDLIYDSRTSNTLMTGPEFVAFISKYQLDSTNSKGSKGSKDSKESKKALVAGGNKKYTVTRKKKRNKNNKKYTRKRH